MRDRATLERWIAAVVGHGSGRIDADSCAMRIAGSVDERGVGFRATVELALERRAGSAAAATCRGVATRRTVRLWRGGPSPRKAGEAASSGPSSALRGLGQGTGAPSGARRAYATPSLFGAAAAGAGIALSDALTLYLQAFAANLMSAGLRLGIIGQTDGQRILAALEPVIAAAVAASC